MLKLILHAILFFQLLNLSRSLNHEGTVLLSLKKVLLNADSALSSWSETESDPCSWQGVSCDKATRSVTRLDLSNTNVAGPFPSLVLCQLKSLSFISFSNNSMNSTLSSDVSDCQALVHLDLSLNYFTGDLPASLADLPNLRHLDLSGNSFTGKVPNEFGTFRKLENLSLISNYLSGRIPPSLGNISTLMQLNLSFNEFSPGPIPYEFGNLKSLEILFLKQCNLVGKIPDSLGSLSKLLDLDLADNNLEGRIPESFSGLVSVSQIELFNNSLVGEIPASFGKLTNLRKFDASTNKLTGTIPEELTRLPLESLHLYENLLSGPLPDSIAQSPNLYELLLFQNSLSGELPGNLGVNSPLQCLDVSGNMFTGVIPQGLCEQRMLSELLLLNNSFTGAIPNGLSQCANLTRVRMSYNQLSGEVPAAFWGLPNVYLLDLVHNSLSGQISKSVATAGEMKSLLLDGNQFDGPMPEELGSLSKLEKLSVTDNKLSGPLPASLLKLPLLGVLDLHGNSLSGELPRDMSNWKKLYSLNLADNKFSGSISDTIGNLSTLSNLDLSSNSFTGSIPQTLEKLKLNQFNFSFNELSGSIPPLYAKKVFKSSFLGNRALCENVDWLCDRTKKGRGNFYAWLLRSIFIAAAVVLVVGVVWFYMRFKNFEKARKFGKSKWTLMSFHKVGFKEDEILGNLDEDNVIGSGSSGKVYKVTLSNGESVAVKKFWTSGKEVNHRDGENEGFVAEVATLGKIRHKNIVKLWCCCRTNDAKLLVYEYMPNGSLGDLLHSSKGGQLNWPTRLKIMIDAAEGLSYLHHDCVPPIVHRDVKSNNILLDSDYGAKVADFGVAKIVESAGKLESMSVIAGSCGYIAPEYAYTLRVNEKSDIYSFGVVMLEMVTGKRPVGAEYGDKDLVKWVGSMVEQNGEESVLDAKLEASFKEEICQVLNLGRLCTSHFHINRPSMRTVAKSLKEIYAANHLHETLPKYADDAFDDPSPGDSYL